MGKNFWNKINKPIITLAPMDGYTDSAFRQTCKKINAKIVLFTEFVSADGLGYRAEKLMEKIKFSKKEKPIIVQLFGKNTNSFITAAKICENLGFDGIDINMGCPSKKVVKSEHGVALRKKPSLALKLVESVANSTKLPVSVKTRLGWSDSKDLLVFAKGIEKAGANLITIHGRTYKQGFSDKADWQPIYRLKKYLKIPVIGNGDIKDIQDGKEKIKNLDGVMIGRAAIGNPWAFNKKQPKNFSEKIPIILYHAKKLFNLKGQKRGSLEIRKHLLSYVKSLPHAAKYRSWLVQVNSLEDIKKSLKKIEQSIHQ